MDNQMRAFQESLRVEEAQDEKRLDRAIRVAEKRRRLQELYAPAMMMQTQMPPPVSIESTLPYQAWAAKTLDTTLGGPTVDAIAERVKAMLDYGPVLLKCEHCGQWGAKYCACKHCGAPIG